MREEINPFLEFKTHNMEFGMEQNNSETFEKSLELFADVAKMNINMFDSLKNKSNRESMRKGYLRLLITEMQCQSIDFLMSQVSPETRKEIMDFAWDYDDEFDRSHVSDGQYIRDFFCHKTGKVI